MYVCMYFRYRVYELTPCRGKTESLEKETFDPCERCIRIDPDLDPAHRSSKPAFFDSLTYLNLNRLDLM